MAKRSSSLAPAEVYTVPRHGHAKKHVPTLVWIVLLVLVALAGFFAGRLLERTKGHADFGQLNGLTVLTEKQLDDVVASYVIDGEVYQITAREAMVQESSLDKMRNEDGTYLMPSAESVLSAARTAILMREVEKRGIEVSNDEYVAYVVETFGTNDAEELAAAYNMDVDTVRDRLRESAAIAKLRNEVAPAASSLPEQPATPAEGEEELRTPIYAAYIIELAGDEWDADQGSWVNYDGPYASALREYDVRPDSASYHAAQTAYNVAYQLSGEGAGNAQAQWTDYVNGLLCEAKLAMSSVVS